jgi:hypothetical protein
MTPKKKAAPTPPEAEPKPADEMTEAEWNLAQLQKRFGLPQPRAPLPGQLPLLEGEK